VWHRFLGKPRVRGEEGGCDAMRGSFLGPRYASDEIRRFLDGRGAPYRELTSCDVPRHVAELLASEQVVGWFQGPMEFGPRALGGRSILGDPRSPRMQSQLNLKIKYRESFRPFAPAVLRERVSDYFSLDRESPYMLLVAPVREERRRPTTAEEQGRFGIDRLNVPRSDIPAVTHVDYSARVQTVSREQNPGFHALLAAFEALTGCPVLVNTSFNVRGEPIVCTPEDAWRCFMRTEMDYLVLENFVLDKRAQPALPRDESWREEFTLD
jgi:carbamoyltransferase